METRKLIVGTLKGLGCQPEVDKEDESIHFMYQGEHFFIVIEDTTVFTIYDTWWGTLNLDDPNILNLKEAINMTNMIATPVTLYSTDEDKNVLGVHSRYRMSFTKEIPNKEVLLKTVLDSFFSVHQEVKGRFSALNDVQLETKKGNRVRIKGFGHAAP